MAGNDGRIVTTIERSIYRVESPNGNVRYKVDKRFGGRDNKKSVRIHRYFDTLEEARVFLKEIFDEHQSKKEWKGYVYFIKNLDTGHIKIGQAVNPVSRFHSVQAVLRIHRTIYRNADPNLKLMGWIEQSLEVNEKLLHLRFKAHRDAGEWFSSKVEKEVKKLLKREDATKPKP